MGDRKKEGQTFVIKIVMRQKCHLLKRNHKYKILDILFVDTNDKIRI